jgi:pimeloyl-ACP methyl ester carboxylesterase
MSAIKDKLKEKVKGATETLKQLTEEAKEVYQSLKQFVSMVEEEDPALMCYERRVEFPIVLIHGYMSGADCWDDFMPWFKQLEYYENEHVFNFAYSDDKNPANGDIIEYAKLFAKKIEEILAQTKKSKVNIIAHSMGGLISRYYIEKLGGVDKVNKLIMLGTPNHGSAPLPEVFEMFAKIEKGIELKVNEIKFLMGKKEEKKIDVFGTAAKLMKPGSDFLNDLGYKAKPNFYLIAGTKGLPIILEEPNDGAVELKSAILENMDEKKIFTYKVNHFDLHKYLKVFNKIMRIMVYS